MMFPYIWLAVALTGLACVIAVILACAVAPVEQEPGEPDETFAREVERRLKV